MLHKIIFISVRHSTYAEQISQNIEAALNNFSGNRYSKKIIGIYTNLQNASIEPNIINII